MDIVKLVYKYLNRFINSSQLLESLEEIKKDNQDNNIDKLIIDIKNIVLEIPNKIDDVLKEEQRNLNKILKKIENLKNSNSCQEELINVYHKLLKEKNIVKDGGKRFERISFLLMENKCIKINFLNMTDKEMFDLITDYIKVPNPLKIEENGFDKLVSLGINEKNSEGLWRLAFNYENKGFNFSRIEDYFIEMRDIYYLTELVCAVKDSLDIKSLVKRVLNTNDVQFIKSVTNILYKYDIFDEMELNEIKSIYQNAGAYKLFEV